MSLYRLSVPFLALLLAAGPLAAQPALPMLACEASPQPPYCGAVRGTRAEGWPLFTPGPAPARSGEGPFSRVVQGVYRAGSDFRKDGEAVGW